MGEPKNIMPLPAMLSDNSIKTNFKARLDDIVCWCVTQSQKRRTKYSCRLFRQSKATASPESVTSCQSDNRRWTSVIPTSSTRTYFLPQQQLPVWPQLATFLLIITLIHLNITLYTVTYTNTNTMWLFQGLLKQLVGQTDKQTKRHSNMLSAILQ